MSKIKLVASLLMLGFVSAALHAADEKPKKDPTEFLQAGTVWQGAAQGDDRKAKNESHPARLRVLEREDNTFTAELIIQRKNGQRAGLKCEGRVKGEQLALRPTKILNGVWGDDVLNTEVPGRIRGEQIVLTPTNKRNMSASIELTLDRDAKGKRTPGEKEEQKEK